MAVEADFIVTNNIDHFPERVSWNRVSIIRTTPDDFLTRLLLDCSGVVVAGYRRQIVCTRTKPRTLEDIVRRLADPQTHLLHLEHHFCRKCLICLERISASRQMRCQV